MISAPPNCSQKKKTTAERCRISLPPTGKKKNREITGIYHVLERDFEKEKKRTLGRSSERFQRSPIAGPKKSLPKERE